MARMSLERENPISRVLSSVANALDALPENCLPHPSALPRAGEIKEGKQAVIRRSQAEPVSHRPESNCDKSEGASSWKDDLIRTLGFQRPIPPRTSEAQ